MNIDRELEAILRLFRHSPLEATGLLTALAENHPHDFAAAAFERAVHPGSEPPNRRLLHLLRRTPEFTGLMLNRHKSTREEAARLLRQIVEADANAVSELLAKAGDGGVQESLALLDTAGLANRIVPWLVAQSQSANAHLRSRAASMLGKLTNQICWALVDADPRVRANAIESVWGARVPEAIDLFTRGLDSGHPRIVGTCLVGLLMAGEDDFAIDVERMSLHSGARYRATAAWVVCRVPREQFKGVVLRLLSDTDPAVRRNAAKALAKLPRATRRHSAEPAAVLLGEAPPAEQWHHNSYLSEDSDSEGDYRPDGQFPSASEIRK